MVIYGVRLGEDFGHWSRMTLDIGHSPSLFQCLISNDIGHYILVNIPNWAFIFCFQFVIKILSVSTKFCRSCDFRDPVSVNQTRRFFCRLLHCSLCSFVVVALVPRSHLGL